MLNERSEGSLAGEGSTMIDQICRTQDLTADGEREGARTPYDTLWVEATRAEYWYPACVVVHFLVHAPVEPEVRLPWHLCVLQAADVVDEVHVRPFYSSLHANLGDIY